MVHVRRRIDRAEGPVQSIGGKVVRHLDPPGQQRLEAIAGQDVLANARDVGRKRGRVVRRAPRRGRRVRRSRSSGGSGTGARSRASVCSTSRPRLVVERSQRRVVRAGGTGTPTTTRACARRLSMITTARVNTNTRVRAHRAAGWRVWAAARCVARRRRRNTRPRPPRIARAPARRRACSRGHAGLQVGQRIGRASLAPCHPRSGVQSSTVPSR